MRRLGLGLAAGLVLAGMHCGGQRSRAPSSSAESSSLRLAYGSRLLIGAAVSTAQLEDPDRSRLLGREFSQVTPENLLKWSEVHPQPGVYNFAPADALVDFAMRHRQSVHGHALVWHQQVPEWVFEGRGATRQGLLARLREHMERVAGRYRGRIRSWDVVNEAFADDGSLRDTPWLRILGADYLEQVFAMAAEVVPDARLVYNDYGLTQPAKREAVLSLLSRLRARNIAIYAVGMQGHYRLEDPSLADVESSVRAFAAAGVKVMFTELDIDVLPAAWEHRGADLDVQHELRPALDPYRRELPPKVAEQLAHRYRELFELFLRHQNSIEAVTLWGIDDGHSWLNNWPVEGRTSYPLLFDRQLQPKSAWHAVVQVAAPQQ